MTDSAAAYFEEEFTPDFFKTNDMGLAAYLTMNGHSRQGHEWRERTCFWKFLLIPSLNELVETWVSQQAQVEPIAYNRAFNEVKRDLLPYLHGGRG